METDLRPATIDRLLTREQIFAITEISDLSAFKDAVMDGIKQIEVDLEFRNDDGADKGWEHRARRALAAHHVCNTRLGQRIKQLQRDGKPVEQPETKARKKEAHAQLLLAQAESRRVKTLADHEKTTRMLVDFASRQSLLMHFHTVAASMLDRATMAEIMAAARLRLEASLAAVHEAPGGQHD